MPGNINSTNELSTTGAKSKTLIPVYLLSGIGYKL